jgi:hypothetical protein
MWLYHHKIDMKNDDDDRFENDLWYVKNVPLFLSLSINLNCQIRLRNKLTNNSKKNQLLPNAKSRVAPDETTH